MPSTHRAPVVLVPGAFGQDLLYWNVMQYFLEREGHPVYSVTFPRFSFTDLRVSADLLSQKVEEVCAVEHVERTHIVAHSMGGLISRYYLSVLHGSDRTKSLVCLGVPHHGTWTGLTAPALKASRQILPGSDFIIELNDPSRMNGASKIPLTNIWSDTDFIVLPPRNARLEGANVRNLHSPFSGHWGLLVNPRVVKWVTRSLDDVERRDT
ncbi:MAG: esterase/lipase family protein [Thermoplasmatota archaeon]